MAQVRIEDVIIYLSDDIKLALEAALGETMPHVRVDEDDLDELFIEFQRGIRDRCFLWESIPNDYVKVS